MIALLQKFRDRSRELGARLPKRADEFDILEIPARFWNSLFVLEVDPSDRLLVRLTGTTIENHLKRSCKGLYMDDIIHGPRSADVLAAFERCKTQATKLLMAQTVEISTSTTLFVMGSVFPLHAAANHPQKLIGLLEFKYLSEVPLPPAQRDSFQIFEL